MLQLAVPRRAAFLLLVLAIASGRSASSASPWLTLTTSHFLVRYHPGDLTPAQRVADSAKDALARIAPKLWGSPSNRIPIFVYTNRPEFARDTRTAPADLVVGVAYGQTDTIRVDASQAFERIPPIVAHELVHILISQRMGSRVDRVPRWLNEGLAESLSGSSGLRSAELLRQASYTGDFIPFEQLTYAMPTGARGALAYAQSRAFVQFLGQSDPSSKLMRALLDRIRAGTTADAAFRAVYGDSLKDLEARWQRSLSPRGWSVFDILNTFGVALAFLVALYLAYRGIVRRKRRIILEDEELYGPDE